MPFKLEEEYAPVPTYDGADSNARDSDFRDRERLDFATSSKVGRKLQKFLLPVSAFLNIVLSVCLIWLAVFESLHKPFQSPLPPWPNNVYSPLQHLVEYETVVFDPSVDHNSSVYRGPPDEESDEAWRLLWDPTLFAEIPAPAPNLLKGKSAPIPSTSTYDAPPHHEVGIDVFHQLHCLDSLRKRLRPARYPDPDWPMRGQDLGHPDHCIESLRFYIMCNADISPVSWRWDEKGKRYVTATTEHICRKWDTIWEWGIAHQRIHDTN